MSKKHKAISAGTLVNEKDGKPVYEKESGSGLFVLKCMDDLEYDLSKNKRWQLTPSLAKQSDKIISMVRKDALPSYLKNSPKLIFWRVKDAKGTSYEFHCKIRDKIKHLVEKLVEEIG